MTRIRQQHPQNYLSSGNISTEFENLIRYLNAAEHGDNTLGELLGKIFDENGNWNVPIKIRKDPSAGIQYRIGTYSDEEKGWINLVTLAEIRGEAGKDFGEIGAPIIFGRADYIATSGQTDFDYAHDATDELLVYVDGILKTPGGSNDYTSDNTGGTNNAGGVTFNAGLMVDEVVTIYKIRATSITGFTRQDTFTTSTQAVFRLFIVHKPSYRCIRTVFFCAKALRMIMLRRRPQTGDIHICHSIWQPYFDHHGREHICAGCNRHDVRGKICKSDIWPYPSGQDQHRRW